MTETPETGAAAGDPEQTALLAARIRRMMLISGITTGIAVAAVLGVIGYRLFRGDASVAVATDVTATLPRGAKIVSTTVSGDRLVVVLDRSGSAEIRTFDVRTLRATGRLNFASEP
jgi:hypothetical protein